MTIDYAPRTATAALKIAHADVGKVVDVDMCQAYVCTRLFGTGAVGDYDHDGAADAQDGWEKAKALGRVVLAKNIKSLKDVPAGVVCFWEGGSHKYGHTAISAGGGNIITTGIDSNPKVSVRAIGYISATWRNGLTFVGYATAVVNASGHVYTVTDKPKAAPKITKSAGKWTVTAKALNGRDYPSTAGSVLRTIEKGHGVTTVGYTDMAGVRWYITGNDTWYCGTYLAKAAPVTYVAKKSDMQNVAGYNAANAPGVTGFKTHIPHIAAAVLKDAPDTFLVNELSNKAKPQMRPLMDAKLKGHLTRAPFGTDGRYVYRATPVKRIASGNIEVAKKNQYLSDDKQCAWLAYELGGARGLDAVYQLAYQDGEIADGKRVAQALDFLTQLLAIAKKYDVPLDNILIAPDANSTGLVRKAMETAGWHAMGKRQTTFRGWDGKSKKELDYAFRHGSSTGDKCTVVKSPDSDHDRLVIEHRLIKEAA